MAMALCQSSGTPSVSNPTLADIFSRSAISAKIYSSKLKNEAITAGYILAYTFFICLRI